MGKPTLQQVSSAVIDPMLSDNFQLSIPSVPGGGNAVPLLMNCQQATKPGITIEPVDVILFGHQLEFAGRLTYSHDLSVTYVENRDGAVAKILEDWAEFIRSHQTQHGAYKADYQRDGRLSIFDNTGTEVRTYLIKNLWPTTVPEVQFDGTAANLITLGASFKYDWVDRLL